MSEGILLFIEQRDGVLNRTSFEAMVAAQGIASATGEKLSAVVLGKSVGGVASEVASKKLETVYVVEDDKIAEYTPDGYVAASKQVIEKTRSAFGNSQPHLSGARLRPEAGSNASKDLRHRLRGISS